MKKFYTLLLIGLVVAGFSVRATAQDPRFSQFYAAPLQLNPAMTGIFDGEWRVALNYRDQWASITDTPYRTISASFDWRRNVFNRDYVAVGATLLGDQSGIALFRQTKGHLSVAYGKQLSGGRYRASQYLVGSLQAGFGQYQIDHQRLWFTEQFDMESESLDLSAPSGEIINDNSGMYFDLNVGLMWYATFDDDKSLYVGGAAHHVNRPSASFIGNSNEILPMRWVLQVGGELPLANSLSLLPAIVTMGQGTSNSFMLGTNIRYKSDHQSEMAIRLGSWIHLANKGDKGIHTDAVIFAAILELHRMSIGLSYDMNVSSLVDATNSRGTYELSFIYTKAAKRRFRVNCPKF